MSSMEIKLLQDRVRILQDRVRILEEENRALEAKLKNKSVDTNEKQVHKENDAVKLRESQACDAAVSVKKTGQYSNVYRRYVSTPLDGKKILPTRSSQILGKKNNNFIVEEHQIEKGSLLGKGEFAATFKAVNLNSGETIALKVPKEDDGAIAAFRMEMMGLIMASGHPNTLHFLGVMFAPRGISAFLTEYCELGSLDKLHDKFDLTETKMFTKITKDLFSGLEHLRRNQLIHRDIACRNILMTKNKELKISDFGLAVRAGTDGKAIASDHDRLPWPWMSPEALRDREFSSSSDVWASGVTLWEITTKGKMPYAEYGSIDNKMREGIINGDIALVPESVVPEWCKKIICGCLEPSLDYRASTSLEEWVLYRISDPTEFRSVWKDTKLQPVAKMLVESVVGSVGMGMSFRCREPEDLKSVERVTVNSKNTLKRICILGGLFPQLKRVVCSGLMLEVLPESISNLTNLIELDLSNNYLTAVPPRLKQLRNLKKLILEGNNIQNVPEWVSKLMA